MLTLPSHQLQKKQMDTACLNTHATGHPKFTSVNENKSIIVDYLQNTVKIQY